MRFKSFTRSLVGLSFSLLFLLTAFARPALAQSADDTAAKTKAPVLGISPGTLNWGKTTVVGVTSAAKTVTLTNKSKTTAITITNIAASSPFSQTGNTCAGSIPASGTCTVSIAFTPTSTKKVTNKKGLTLTDSAQKSPQHVELEGQGKKGTAPTVTPTPTPSVTPTPTPSATPTPGSGPKAQTGDVLIAGGDAGNKLGGLVALASFGHSTNGAQFYHGTTNAIVATGLPLNQDRESAAQVVLPNGKILIVGGEHCFPTTYGTTSGFQCNALNTAELYDKTTNIFTLAGSGSSGVMTSARTGPTATLISGSGTGLDGQVLIVGGAMGSSYTTTATSFSSTALPPSGQTALPSAELYNPATDAFTATTAVPGCAAGTICGTAIPSVCSGGVSSAISGATEAGTTVTITMSSANPSGLTVGGGVTIADVAIGAPPSNVSTAAGGYNGTFVVIAIPTGSTFTYTAGNSGLAAGTGGTAASDTVECGLEDHQAALIPADSGKVLLAGGDNFTFLAAASTQAFIFDPSTAAWSATGSMTTPRELFQLTALDPAFVSGTLAGQVLATGGVNGLSAGCATSGDVLATTTNTAELYNPTAGTWTATTTTMSTKRAGHGTVLWTTGPLAGKLMSVGGINIQDGTLPSTCDILNNLQQTTTTSVDIFDPGTGAEGTFTATTPMNQARGGMGAGFIGVGSNSGDFIVMGGECAFGALTSYVVGSSTSTACDKNAPNDYSELFDPNASTWTVGPGPASGVLPTNGPISADVP